MKPALILAAIMFALAIPGQPALAESPETDAQLGERLVQELWVDLKAANMPAHEKRLAEGFQSVHQDGARDRKHQLDLLKKLDMGEYYLSAFRTTRVGDTIIVTYVVSVTETIADKRLDTSPAVRLSVFVHNGDMWQWAAHANLNPME